MEKKKIIEQLKELEIEFRKNNPDVIGYILFNTVNRKSLIWAYRQVRLSRLIKNVYSKQLQYLTD
ncbi:hypothetical protein [Arsenophonus sp.]|uniref:hypothetical protein n=1 Tax=Arsenophonus sp. TaxID=1872640 RepID=UPI00387A5D35